MREIPFFSVIVPVYNNEIFLTACMESILGQQFTDFEVIVVNDGSSDNSEAVVKTYLDKDPRVRYFCKQNGGVGSARNCGIDVARGKYLVFLDSDDVLVENSLFVANSAMKSIGENDIFICDGYIEMSGDNMHENIMFSEQTIDSQFKDYKIKELCQNLSSMCIGIYKKEFLTRNNIRVREDITCAEDTDFIFRSIVQCETIRIIRCTLFKYRNNTQSVSNNLSYKSINSVLQVCSYHLQKLKSNTNYDINITKALDFFGSKYIHFAIKAAKLKKEQRTELLNRIEDEKKLLGNVQSIPDKSFVILLKIVGAGLCVKIFDYLVYIRNKIKR